MPSTSPYNGESSDGCILISNPIRAGLVDAHSRNRTDSHRSALTIGYGDLVPDNTWSKILVFPFSILTISQLANEIYIIFGFIGKRAQERRERWRKRYEGAMHAEANRRRPKAGLLEEMALIDHINKREELYVGAVSPFEPSCFQSDTDDLSPCIPYQEDGCNSCDSCDSCDSC
jgi:hypothetical protein